MTNSPEKWDVQYEWKAVLLLSTGFGLVGLDRFMIAPLFPVMMKDMGLQYQDLGQIAAALAISWGISALFIGRLADRLGPRKVVIPALIMFSLLAGLSGLATGVGSLIAIRAVMGFAEGAYTPASITASLEASKPSRHGFNIGLQQMAAPLVGLGLAPILVTQLLKVVDWRWVFLIVSIPGFIVAYLMFKTIRNPDRDMLAASTSTHDVTEHKWTDVFKYRNTLLTMAGMLCWLTCVMVTSALFPNYLTDYLRLDVQNMGFVMSAIGFGASVGSVLLPSISDRVRRKPIMIVSVLGATFFLYQLMNCGAEPVRLFTYLFFTHFFNMSAICLTNGAICAESVPAKLMTTATGLTIGAGELFGGGAMPAIAGYVAQHFGIQYILHLALIALGFGFVIVLMLEETAPCKVGRKSHDEAVLGNAR